MGSIMKGVVLAGGSGTRLSPLTKVTNKHLLPIYNKPMIYYPLECLRKAGIEEVMLVTGGNNVGDFIRLLGNGKEFGFKELAYTYQDRAGGVADALGLAEHFAEGGPICLILGDNIVEYHIGPSAEAFRQQKTGARILLSQVDNPDAYGVAEFDGPKLAGIVEKPANPPSNWAIIGIYFYDNDVFRIIKTLAPSHRGELEITDVNNEYLRRGQLQADKLQGWWADAGENIDFYLRANVTVAQSGANKDRAG